MLRRQYIPLVVTLLAAFLCGGFASRLRLLAVLFAKPLLTLAVTALLFFVIQRSSDLCRSLLLGGVVGNLSHAPLNRLPRRHLHCYFDLQLDFADAPCLRTRFQRPPPAIS
jgi:hypothetical protein